MADSYIDQNETIGYGEFAARQIKVLAVGLDPDFDEVLHVVSERLARATKAMSGALMKAGELKRSTFASAANAGHDPASEARELLGRAVKYAESRQDGDAIAQDLLGGEGLSTVKRRRPAKLVHALDVAIKAFGKHKASLPEHAKWTADLKAVREALNKLDATVRASRLDRRAMTPEVAAARDRWLNVYGAAKLIVEGVLRLNNALVRMPDIFDDLAEVHQVSGVTDDSVAEPAAAPPAAPPAIAKPS